MLNNKTIKTAEHYLPLIPYKMKSQKEKIPPTINSRRDFLV
jgi:hypothetical protein